MFRCALACCLLLTLAVLPAGAAEVVLNNGMHLFGELTAETETTFTLQIDGAPFTVQKDTVQTLRYQEKLYTLDGTPGILLSTLDQQPQSTGAINAAPLPADGEPVELPTPPFDPALLPLAPAALPEGRLVEVTGNSVRLREGPGTDFSVVSYVHEGTLLAVQQEEDDWYQCTGSGKRSGWIFADLVVDREITYGLVTGQRVNVRERAGTQYRTFGRLTKGSVVAVVGTAGEWHQIYTANGTFGYMHGDYLQPVDNLSLLRPPLRSCDSLPSQPPLTLNRPPDKPAQLLFSLREDVFVRSGQAALLLFYPKQPQELASLLTDARQIQWYTFAADSAMVKSLGIVSRSRRGGDVALAVHLAGEWSDADGWTFRLPVGAELPAAVFLVAQEGAERGCLLPLSTSSE